MRKLISEQELFRFDRPLKVKVYENEWMEPEEGEVVVERLVLEVECESLTSPHVTGLCHVYWRDGSRSPSAYFTFKPKPSLLTTLSSVLKEGELAARLEAMLLVTALGHPNRDFEKDYRTVLSLLDDCVVTPSVMEQVRDYYETTGGDSLQWRLSNIPFHCLPEAVQIRLLTDYINGSWKNSSECFAAHMDETRKAKAKK